MVEELKKEIDQVAKEYFEKKEAEKTEGLKIRKVEDLDQP